MSDAKEDLFKTYESYSSTLRTWLVSYGVGAPVLLISNEKIWDTLKTHPLSSVIAATFLGGVALQVLLASLNKYTMWFCYRGEEEPSFREKRFYRFSCWVAGQFWIDILCDMLSIVSFAYATYLTVVCVK